MAIHKTGIKNCISVNFGIYNTVKTCLKRPLKKYQKLVFKNNYHLMQVKNIAECSKGSILQYFRPSLSYHLSFRSLFCLFFEFVLSFFEWLFYTGFTVYNIKDICY